MKNNIYPQRIRNFVATGLAIAVLTTSSMVALATPDRQLMGELTVTGASAASVNGERAATGRSISSSSVVATSAETTAIINLGKIGRIELAPNSSLSLNFDEKTISGSINDGSVKVSSAPGVEVKLATKAGEITNEASQLNVFSVDTAGKVVTESGQQTGGQQTGGQTNDDITDHEAFIPVAILLGAVAVTVVYLATTEDDENLTVVSAVR
ncbi:MAG TPA: hypothetical protein VF571_16895 [Pyrinomonadaceae bacterium]|jgi:hypothetical protein